MIYYILQHIFYLIIKKNHLLLMNVWAQVWYVLTYYLSTQYIIYNLKIITSLYTYE